MIDLDDFITRAALAGLGVALAAGPLGCFVVWRKMAYFGDATAHSALLGVSIGLAIGTSPLVGAVLITLAMALIVAGLAERGGYAADTILGVAAHSALALGVIAVSMTPGLRVDLIGYLFGDVLAVDRTDLAVIWGGAGLSLAVLAWRWRALLDTALSEPLAVAEGRSPFLARLTLTGLLALTISIAMQVVGLLLVTAMLILPAAAARPLSRTPEAMALIAAAFGGGGALIGLSVSFQLDSPTGPTIVAVQAALFLVTALGAAALTAARRW